MYCPTLWIHISSSSDRLLVLTGITCLAQGVMTSHCMTCPVCEYCSMLPAIIVCIVVAFTVSEIFCHQSARLCLCRVCVWTRSPCCVSYSPFTGGSMSDIRTPVCTLVAYLYLSLGFQSVNVFIPDFCGGLCFGFFIRYITTADATLCWLRVQHSCCHVGMSLLLCFCFAFLLYVAVLCYAVMCFASLFCYENYVFCAVLCLYVLY